MTGRSALLLGALVALGLPPASADPVEPAPANAVWDLRPLYADAAAWDADYATIDKAIPGLAALKGTLKDGKSLLAAFDRIWEVRRRLHRLGAYAQLSADLDTRVAANQARRDRAEALGTRVDEATAWLDPEINRLGRAKIQSFYATTPGLAKDRHALDTVLRLADHTLSPESEAVLAAAAEPLDQPQSIYQMLADADLPWPKLDIRGQTVTLDSEAYVANRSDRDPEIRKRVFDAFWPVWKSYERTFGATYAANVKSTVFEARIRRYPSPLGAALAETDVPEPVYRTLIDETHNGLKTLHRYLVDSRKLLGLKELRYSDLYVPLADPPRRYTLDEAEALTLDAVAPLGADYVKDLRTGFASNWMHAWPGAGKKSGAYEDGIAYDVHPYLLLSFYGNFKSVSTLAHEWGHAMHTVLANRAQPIETADYPIFIAEIPSTTNEMLLGDHVIATARNRAERIFAISQELELLRTTFFRQALLAEFEAKAHDAVWRGEALTGESLSKTYLDLLKLYLGDAENVTKIDDLYGIEWAYIPHFYTDFYVYQYASSISAAAYFADGIERGDTAVRDRFLDLLKAGGSDDPYTLVKKAGLDMATPTPYRALVARMDRLLDQLEKAMAE